MTCLNTLADDLGLYALGALDDGDTARFESHLADCPACSAELAELRQVVSLLPRAVPEVEPPAVVGRRLEQRLARRPSRMRSQPWLPLALAASLALAVGAGASTAYWAGRTAGDETRIAALASQNQLDHQAISALAGASGRVLALHGMGPAPAAYGVVRLDPSGDSVTLVVYGLPAPGAGHVYQGWLHLGRRRVSVGTFLPQGSSGTVVFAGAGIPAAALGAADGFGITAEPAGGSSFPTVPPVAAA